MSAHGIRTILFSTVGYVAARVIAATMRLSTYGEEKIEAARSRHSGVILATWHGRTFVPITHYRGRGYWAFVSTSRDGEYQNTLLGWFGWQRVRGSTSSRGAVTAALRMARELRNGAVLAHTPDGPRGPSHVVHPGAIFLGEKSGCPIIPAGVSAYPALRLKAWDRYVVPKLFARCVILYGEPMLIPPNLTEPQRAELCLRLGDEITRLEAEADALAERPDGGRAVEREHEMSDADDR